MNAKKIKWKLTSSLVLSLSSILCSAIPASAANTDSGQADSAIMVNEPVSGHVISAGANSSAVIDADGILHVWGSNYYGQLGNGTHESSRTPLQLLDNVSAVYMGQTHAAAVKTDSSLWVWGNNKCGQLGNNTLEKSLTPIKIMDNVIDVSVGEYITAAVTADGSLWMWGDNSHWLLGDHKGNIKDEYGTLLQTHPLKIMDDVSAVSIGQGFVAVIKRDTSLWMWGDNSYGQLGIGMDTAKSNSWGSLWQAEPVRVMENVTAIGTGKSHTAAITSDGSLWMWGLNADGQIGNGKVFARKENNTHTWHHYGYSYEDCKAVCEDKPVKILDHVVSVSAGANHTMAVTSDGSLWAWGRNQLGQLGIGTSGTDNKEDEIRKSTPIKVMDNVASVSAGNGFTIAVKTDASIWTWGRNTNGQLGNDTWQNSPESIRLPNLTARAAVLNLPASTE